MVKNKAVFIDRDGVISKLPIKSGGDRLYRIEDFEEIPDSFKALKKLQKNGYKIILISNQAGIAKGIFTEKDYYKLEKYIENQAKKHGVAIDAAYFCPFHRNAVIKKYKHPDHPDRKPNPGMLIKAIKKFNIDISKSFMIGDNISDMGAGENAGVYNIFVLTGHGKKYKSKLSNLKNKPVYVACDLKSAGNWILNNQEI